MRTFSIIWFGQLVSMLGSAMTRFALVAYLWEKTQEATPVVLIGVIMGLGSAAASLVAGVLVDRWNRKLTIIGGDLGTGVGTLLLLALLGMGDLPLWAIYTAAGLAGICGAFQGLAFSASTTLLVPPEQYQRAAAMMSLAEYLSIVAAPALAGLLINSAGLGAVLLLDVITFLFAVMTAALTRIPQPAPQAQETSPPFWREIGFGFRYIWARPALVSLLMLLFGFTLLEALGYPLLAPMLLARTGGDETTLGLVQSVMGVGGLIGGAAISAWGGPKRRIYGLIAGMILTGLFGDMLMGLGQTLPVWMLAGFCLETFIPLVVSANAALWQAKVEPAVQGRVFAVRRMIGQTAEPIAAIAAGVLADQVFEPAMQPGGALAGIFGGWVGTGDGAGMALLLVLCGILATLAGVIGFAIPALRRIDVDLPDQVTQAASP